MNVLKIFIAGILTLALLAGNGAAAEAPRVKKRTKAKAAPAPAAAPAPDPSERGAQPPSQSQNESRSSSSSGQTSPTPPSSPQSGENLGSVEVTGQAKDKVNIEKMTPEIKIDVRDVVDSSTEKTERLLERSAAIPAPEDFDRFNTLASLQTPRPWLPDLAEPPLISFLPEPSKTTVIGWRLEVTDEKGDIVQSIAGKGNPVKEIVWDGLDKKGGILKVATAYSYRFITIDEFNNVHTTLGKAFTLRHLKYRDKKFLVVEVSSETLFKDDKLRPEALPLFERVIDVLRENSNFPLAVEFCTDAPQGDLVKARQKLVTEKIVKDMLLPSESVRYVYKKIEDRGDVVRFVMKVYS